MQSKKLTNEPDQLLIAILHSIHKEDLEALEELLKQPLAQTFFE